MKASRFCLPSLGSIALFTLAIPASAQRWLDTPLFVPEAQSGRFGGIGDVDGLGGTDLILFEGPPASPADFTGFRVYFNDGSGDFTPGPLTPLPPTENRGPLGPGLADVTGDGLLDVLISGNFPVYGFGIDPGLPGGGFGPFAGVHLENRVVDADVGDPDGDGVLDIAIMNRAVNENQSDLLLRWWSWNGMGFTPSATVTIPGAFPEPFPYVDKQRHYADQPAPRATLARMISRMDRGKPRRGFSTLPCGMPCANCSSSTLGNVRR